MRIFEIEPNWREVLEAVGLASFEALWETSFPPLKRKTDREILRFELAGRPLYLKRYFRFGWREFRTGAEREWWAARELARRGFGVPEPVAFGLERNWRPRRALSLFVGAPGERLEDLLRRSPEAYREILPVLVETAVRFHGEGFSHQDFYLCHLFWDGGRLVLIDLQRVRRSERPRIRWIVKDLAELFYSARTVLGPVSPDFERDFLSAYARFHPWIQSPGVIKKIEKKIRRIAAHDAKLKARGGA
ncbi:lipopolysaccharide kinase InaA family protein [Thermosulfurimonas sp. F29]|uniref:lipopolysaccharide kinase InaA family protein n=1 Tax=Thermosulfurimonas sp. F29 TaxID=2867247 RepID=UPI001C8347C2|nr:lipopolysaccharide kinase InaA family protein [Thermosulfurimonas sp. F29]MBX6423967.1 hypothetical protein [Thermosulfurimonas sp. F29]